MGVDDGRLSWPIESSGTTRLKVICTTGKLRDQDSLRERPLADKAQTSRDFSTSVGCPERLRFVAHLSSGAELDDRATVCTLLSDAHSPIIEV